MTDESPREQLPASSGLVDCEALPRHLLAAGLAWAVVVAIGGGFICGLLLERLVGHRVLAYLSLMAIGILGGVISRMITGRSEPLLGWALVVAVFVAMALGQVYFIRALGENENTWWEAFAVWPQMIGNANFRYSNLVGFFCAAMGAHSAYWRAGKRFRRVMVRDS